MTRSDRRSAGRVVEPLSPDQMDEAVDVVCEAFRDYPVMRFVIGDAGAEYADRLRTLVSLFVAARFWRGEPALAVADAGRIVAVAITTPPGTREEPPALAAQREHVWARLGRDARGRYEMLGEVWKHFAIDEIHYHLNMIGVRPSHAGRGLGGLLLNAVHDMSARDPASSGVSLTTEDPVNVSLYERFGYRIVGHVAVNGSLETWGFFRPDDGSG